MKYLLKVYDQEWTGEFIKQTLVILTDEEFIEFKQSHEAISDDAWRGESNSNSYDKDKYDSDYFLLETEKM